MSTKQELIAKCKELNIKGISGKSKPELEKLLESQNIENNIKRRI